ncbi:MAG TPA: hypothetical protein PKI03_30145, partial [Pseudomonadota bacterium]|nr:hypothetical protein [Pseudomonadota bacterium]
IIRDAMNASPPPTRLGNRLGKVYYVAQVASNPRTIAFVVNDPELFDETYIRYLTKAIRDHGPFEEVPIKVILKPRNQTPKWASKEESESDHSADAEPEAANPPPKPRKPAKPRPPRGAGCPTDHRACKLGIEGAACGLPAALVLAAAQGAPVPRLARYCLLTVARLIPSHDPLRGFRPRPEYPSGVQERDYQRDKAEQLKVLGIAQNLIPELVFNGAPGAIDGLPVVTHEGYVLGGNGRSMALQLHYAHGGLAAADYVRDHAAQFGFSRAQVESVAQPVIVRTIETTHPADRGELRELVRLLNIPLTQTLDLRSETVAEAQRLTSDALDVLAVALAAPEATLRDYLSSRESRTLANALRRAGILTDNNAKRLLTADGFSEDGKIFVERLLTAALIPDAVLLDAAGGGLLGTLARSAPWLLAAASGGAGWDLRPSLRAAVADYIELRAAGMPSVSAYLRQGRIEGPPHVTGDPRAVELLELLHEVGGKPLAFARFARRYAELAQAHPTAQGGLFAAEKRTPDQALRDARAAV